MNIKKIFEPKMISIMLAVVDTCIFGLRKAKDIQEGKGYNIESFINGKIGEFNIKSVTVERDPEDVIDLNDVEEEES